MINIDPKTGLVKPPIYPCYKGEGLCKIRRSNTGKFECAQNPDHCSYKRIPKLPIDKEVKQGL